MGGVVLGGAVALLHFLVELLSGQVALHSVSGCCVLPRQINIDSLLSCLLILLKDGKGRGQLVI